jgi:hypothetical protein
MSIEHVAPIINSSVNPQALVSHYANPKAELSHQQAMQIIQRYNAHHTHAAAQHGFDWFGLASKPAASENWQSRLVDWMTQGTEQNFKTLGEKSHQLFDWLKAGTPGNIDWAHHKAADVSHWVQSPETQKTAGNISHDWAFWVGNSLKTNINELKWTGNQLANAGKQIPHLMANAKSALTEQLHNKALEHAGHADNWFNQAWLNIDNFALQHLDKAKMVSQQVSQNADNWLGNVIHHIPHPNTPTEMGLSAAALGIAGGLGWLGAKLSGRMAKPLITTAEKTVIKTL